MPDTTTPDPEPIVTMPPAVVLWFRPRRGKAWEIVAHVATEREAWSLVGTGGRKNGDWLTLPSGTQP